MFVTCSFYHCDICYSDCVSNHLKKANKVDLKNKMYGIREIKMLKFKKCLFAVSLG